MSLLNVIDYRGSADNKWLVYRHPNKEFNSNSKLIVGVGQVAAIVHGGKLESIVENGTHILDNLNMPFLSTLQKNKHGGGTPFPMEIYFINKTLKLDMLWGTMDPIMILEPKFNVRVNVRARGQFGIRINNYQFLLTQLLGSIGSTFVRFETINSFFRGLINTRIKTILSKEISANKISILDINIHLEDFSAKTLESLKPEFEKYGFELVNFYYTSINLPEDDLSVINNILNKNAEFDILGADRYNTSRSFDVLESAAKNESAGNLASAGVGLGLGSSLAKDTMNIKKEVDENSKTCISCGTKVGTNDKFCPKCGTAQVTTCVSCNSVLKPGSKFCSKCGTAVNEVNANEK